MPRHWSPPPVFGVLLVCTGNICRSPLAERLGRAYVDEALGDEARLVHLTSAGTHAVIGSEMHPDSALVLRGLGGDPSGFRARQLVGDLAIDADLTLTMTRRQRRDVLAVAPRALSRTYTLREAADLLRLIGDDAVSPETGLADRARSLVAQMAARRTRRQMGPDDDIQDPVGLPIGIHQEVGETISEAVLTVLGRVVGLRGGVPDALAAQIADGEGDPRSATPR